uniref:Major facilitator superfamily (MFS) profile domain-containing protein n=1 Tax=Amphimedon queenslandica TaxID=400682 RepID=A0A1X7V8D9_AMPQE
MDSTSTERSSSTNTIDKKKKFKRYWNELRSRSLNVPTVLLLIYSATIPLSHKTLNNIIPGFVGRNECENSNYIEDPLTINSLNVLSVSSLFLLIPFCGWLSDTKIGRGNAVYLSLWVGWLGSLLQALACCLQYYESCDRITVIGRYTLSSLAGIFLIISLAFMYTNILPYGIDQMMHLSSVKIRSFIHWLVWVYFFFDTIPLNIIFSFANYKTFVLINAVVACALFSLSLCLQFHLKHRFEHIPIPNPYKTVFKVLKSSLKRNRNKLQRRSAFTYWGKEPSRIDLAKERYGGPFSHEQVENVKTFLRILAVLAATFGFFIVFNSFVSAISASLPLQNGNNGLQGHAHYEIWFIAYGALLALIPVCELLILPLFPKFEYFLMNPLRGIGLANVLLTISIISLFLINLIGRHVSSSFTIEDRSDDSVPYWILLIPTVLAGTSLVILWLCSFEFLCSQAPFGMHGMIIGLFWFLYGAFNDIGTIILFLIYSFTYDSSKSFMSYTTITFGVIALLGLVLYILVARWYVKRVRDTDLNLRTVVENNWEQQLIKKSSYNQNDEFTVATDDEQ